MIALRKSDGSVAWRQSGIAESWSTPALYANPAGTMELAVTVKNKVLAFNPTDGTPLWNFEGIPDYICPSIVVHEGVLFASGARRRNARHPLGRHRRRDCVAQGLGYRQGLQCLVSRLSRGVFVFGQGAIRYSLLHRADAGEIVYEERLKPDSRLIYASPLLADGKIYYVSRENGTYVVPAKPEFAILAHNRLADDTSIFNASPVPVGKGEFLLRSDKFLYRIGHKSGPAACGRGRVVNDPAGIISVICRSFDFRRRLVDKLVVIAAPPGEGNHARAAGFLDSTFAAQCVHDGEKSLGRRDR